MKFYNLETKFEFGIYNQKTLNEVFNIDKSYVEWCLMNLDHFLIEDAVIDCIQIFNPEFKLTQEAEEVREAKLIEYCKAQELNDVDDCFDEDENDFSEDEYGSSGEKYGWYNGFSDDAIDDAFEGDPMNTWNVD